MSDDNIECLEFRCKISKNVIEYKCQKKEKKAFMEYSFIDVRLPKSFMVLLRSSIDQLREKGYVGVVQSVLEDDWNKFLKKDKWKLVERVKYPAIGVCCVIECEIGDAIGCVARGLGVG
ncbi:MAG: hypothetical protein Hyperionvirus8_10 [Hyperionvirus sp.]|uniref:Uncharacterized protein n=1 Tax=Hyperionvirus sp. TaxID=2487770 RepID=A0A3G5A8D9_9VIRU|nr:MAG: hypothetical protein Hyperionvirus8_10 [Hyperionvirus sp.]